MKIITTLLISLFMSFGLVQMASAEITIQAFVSDTNIVLGQQIILNVSINDIDAKYQLDSEPLNNNFQVFLPSQSRQNQNINGKISKKTTWRIPLKAKKIGQLLIPSLSVGPLKTKPIQIQVKTYSATTSNISKVVFMQNKLDKDSVYIGQTFTLTSMIFISKDTDNLELSPPFADNASIELQQEDKNGIVIRNGIRYQTITRQYKITPNKAGKISIIPPFLSGSLRNIIQINQWQNKIISEPINIQGKALKITVKAIPKNFKTEWIISEDLRLIEHTDLTKQSYHVGDPITRTVTLEIASVDKDKLPTINFNYPDALRNYPDKDIFSQQITNGLTYATRTFKHVIIADKTGPLILPEIKITWWNSQTDQQQITTLPTQTLTILAEERTTTLNVPPPSMTQKMLPAKSTPVNVENETLNYWKISTIIFSLLFVVTLALLLIKKQGTKSETEEKGLTSSTSKSAYFILQNKIKKGQSTEIYHALLIYAQQRFPTLKSVTQLASMSSLNNDEKQQLDKAIKCLEYACVQGKNEYTTHDLRLLIQKIQQCKNVRYTDDVLCLNPTKK